MSKSIKAIVALSFVAIVAACGDAQQDDGTTETVVYTQPTSSKM